MASKTREEVTGIEFDWLAIDGEGNVAFFSTAGGGYAPSAFLADTDAHDAAIADLLAMLPRTEARFLREISADREDTWRMMAERGVFAFDSDPTGGPYRLVAAPKAPIRPEQLPATVARVVASLAYEHLRFSELQEMDDALLRA